MPNHHIYHYRIVGRPYKYMTYLLAGCLAFTLSMLLYTNRGRLENGIIPVRSERGIYKRNIKVAERMMLERSKMPRDSSTQSDSDDIGDVVLQVEPFQPLAETFLNNLYDGMEKSKTKSRTLKSRQKASVSFTSQNNNQMDIIQHAKTTSKPTTTTTTKTATTTTTTTTKKRIKTTTATKATPKPIENVKRINSHVSEIYIKSAKSSSSLSSSQNYTNKAQSSLHPKDILHHSSSISTFGTTNTHRLKRVAEACLRFDDILKKSRPQAEFYHSPKHNLLYCKVAKGGCTFWEQLFSFILRPESMKASNYTTMYDIPRWRIHFDEEITPPSKYWWWSFKKTISNTTTRFMFTRDPFTRIWSAYVDKIWLPDFWFWMVIGKHKTLDVRDRCLYDVSFSDFVQYISVRSKSNKHWAPVHQSCNPCVFQPHIIGNMSSFVNDAKNILKTSGLDSVLSLHDHKTRVSKELRMLVQYNYKRLEQRHTIYKYCNFTEKTLAHRLWRTFQINGYISRTHNLPDNLASYDENSVLSSILDNVENHSLSHEENEAQRRYYLHRAYQSVPRHIIEGMLKRFEADFELFDFDKYPPFLLKEGETPVPFDW